ncbi:hypothetical protein F1188_09575 [Roseospira marina]|uniref:Uncharacterized protein n=1 Tax=Roseospira marina TaxID=140057 RepID=A0A5M6IC38_9PROT|nr:hypothetical protein [Roseospira marina]KAA5605850.1 hypothetical protein F1188_09575 [Roseospira marina]MBB4313669.1 hypothetical protein [Roseospira marina]MBB5086831.1 hypothetical protein [Roseospira marina]
MKWLLSDKRVYFSVFGAVGGLASAMLYGIVGLHSALASWVVGTGLDGMCIAGLLAFAQTQYVGKVADWKSVTKGVVIGGIGGMIGGYVALTAGFPIAELLGGQADAGRFLGWTLGGLAVGFAVSWVIPNLKVATASFAGAVGGFIGCGLMYLVSTLAAGTATTGAVIGLAIALAETAFRRAWLEVTIRPKGMSLEKERTITVTLGKDPVVFGCAADADVNVAEMAGAKAHLAKVSLVNGAVTLVDMTTETTRTLAVDEGFDVSNAHAVVRSRPTEMPA